MVNSNDGHPGVSRSDIDLDGGLGEGGVYCRVDGDGVVRVGGAAGEKYLSLSIHIGDTTCDSLAGNVHNDAQSPLGTGLGNVVGGQELGDRLRQVDAVDKDVDCGRNNTC